MKDRYPMLNGRGYPDTLVEGALDLPDETGGREWAAGTGPQPVSSLITATPGQRVLLRLSNLNVTRFYTLATLGVSMKVVGWNARLLRGPDGKDLYYSTNSVTLGGGEAADVLIDIPTLAVPGTTYFLYTTNLNHLSNDKEDFGGMMTEIRVGSGS
jgi:FtsP/CotA-like multicopper oxidase with cupredoxin domain